MGAEDLDLREVDTYAEAARLIRRQGFALFKVGDRLPWSRAEPIFEGLRRISAIPLEEQLRWRVDQSKDGDQDDGLLLRRPEIPNPGASSGVAKVGKGSDNKNIMMFRHQVPGWLAQRGVATGPEWQEFWDAQREMWSVCFDIAAGFAGALDREFDYRYGILDGLLRNACASKLRSQFYRGARHNDAKSIAQEHTDRSGISVHALEDHPGLVIMHEGEAVLLPAAPGRVVGFAGEQLQQITGGQMHYVQVRDKVKRVVTGGEVQALRHAAQFVDTPERPWPGGRHMAVFFARLLEDDNDYPYGPLRKP